MLKVLLMCVNLSFAEAEVKSAAATSQTTWTGWAVGAITSKFYKTSSGGAQPQKQVIWGMLKGFWIYLYS